jgi:hypothetical protein
MKLQKELPKLKRYTLAGQMTVDPATLHLTRGWN